MAALPPPAPGCSFSTKCPGHRHTAPGLGETNASKEETSPRRSRPRPTGMEGPAQKHQNTPGNRHRMNLKFDLNTKETRVNCSTLAYNPGVQRQTSNTVVDSAHAHRDTCTLHKHRVPIRPQCPQVKLPWVPHLSSIPHSGLLHMLFLLPGTPFLSGPSLHG